MNKLTKKFTANIEKWLKLGVVKKTGAPAVKVDWEDIAKFINKVSRDTVKRAYKRLLIMPEDKIYKIDYNERIRDIAKKDFNIKL